MPSWAVLLLHKIFVNSLLCSLLQRKPTITEYSWRLYFLSTTLLRKNCLCKKGMKLTANSRLCCHYFWRIMQYLVSGCSRRMIIQGQRTRWGRWGIRPTTFWTRISVKVCNEPVMFHFICTAFDTARQTEVHFVFRSNHHAPRTGTIDVSWAY